MSARPVAGAQAALRLEGRVAVVTGGSGGLGSSMADALADAGAGVALLSRRPERSETVAARIRDRGGEARAIRCDVTDPDSLARARDEVNAELGAAHILVNGAGGNDVRATTGAERSFFDLEPAALRGVLDVNLLGTVQACQAFGRDMVERGEGVIVNVSSMAAARPLTRVVGYAAAKAAVENFTRWLAVHMARTYAPGVRVNALSPGFFLTRQNQYLMVDAESGELTSRGADAVGHTPQGRLGAPRDLASTLLWLVDPDSGFVTGAVIPVDGGFSAFGGV